jgi:hypothetical protein
MSAQSTISSPIRLRRARLIAGAGATIATAAAVAAVAISPGTTPTQRSTAPSAAEQRYINAIASMTPSQQAAAFGTEGIDGTQLTPAQNRYIHGMASLSRTRSTAAFGTGR